MKTFLDLTPFHLQGENLDINNLRNPNYWRDFYVTVQSQISKVVSLLRDINEIPEPAGVPLSDTVAMNEVLDAAWRFECDDFGAKAIKVDIIKGEIPEIAGSRLLLEKAVKLLLLDELANVPSGGHIVLKTSAALDESGRPGVKFEISDNGPGLSASNVTCIFDPFFVRQNNPEEYGLNLLTCFFIVYHHSGKMTVDVSAEGGARFEVFLPQQSKEAVPHAEESFLERVFDMEKTWEKLLVGA